MAHVVRTLEQSPELVALAREWLCDCFGEQEDEIMDATPRRIAREIERLWDGGADGFILTHRDDVTG